MTSSIASIRSLTLDLPPSCIAFCPTRPRYFVVGTYFLHTTAKQEQNHAADDAVSREGAGDETPQKRSGSLILFALDGDEIKLIATEPTPEFSILDIQWTPHTTSLGELLAVATSTGRVSFYRLDVGQEGARLVCICSKRICDPSVLVLSLAWDPRCESTIGVTLSDGRVCMVECTNSSTTTWKEESSAFRVTTVCQHSLEAWWLAFYTHSSEGVTSSDVFSGGDDMVLQRSSMPNNDTGNSSVSLWQDRRIHQAGVTAILPLGDDLILTGSYDDHIRLISAPPAGRRRLLAEENLGGGVWRLEVLEEEGGPSSAASTTTADSAALQSAPKRCMHAGARVVRLTQQSREDWAFEVLAMFEEHESMNYGSGVQPTKGLVKKIISTSFYDKLLCLWEVQVGCAGGLKNLMPDR